jgi:hypothetical protein
MYNGPKRHVMKKCTKCLQDKIYSEFYKKISSKDGYNNICIACRIEYNTLKKEDTQLYYQKNKEKHQLNSKKYYQLNTEKVNQKSILWQKNNPLSSKKTRVKWQSQNQEYFKEWRNRTYQTNPRFKLRIILGNRLNEILKKNKTYKTNSILNLIGCNLQELKLYLESKFLQGMTWENHGGIWEIDHIQPCSSFDLTQKIEQQKCFHYTNLQPLFKTTQIAQSLGYINEIGNRNKSSN